MILCRRCVAVGTPGGYSLYTLNSTDALEPVYQSGEILLLVIIEILLLVIIEIILLLVIIET